jgi:hypothetical protein
MMGGEQKAAHGGTQLAFVVFDSTSLFYLRSTYPFYFGCTWGMGWLDYMRIGNGIDLSHRCHLGRGVCADLGVLIWERLFSQRVFFCLVSVLCWSAGGFLHVCATRKHLLQHIFGSGNVVYSEGAGKRNKAGRDEKEGNGKGESGVRGKVAKK